MRQGYPPGLKWPISHLKHLVRPLILDLIVFWCNFMKAAKLVIWFYTWKLWEMAHFFFYQCCIPTKTNEYIALHGALNCTELSLITQVCCSRRLLGYWQDFVDVKIQVRVHTSMYLWRRGNPIRMVWCGGYYTFWNRSSALSWSS
jgi:hypothetical protein